MNAEKALHRWWHILFPILVQVTNPCLDYVVWMICGQQCNFIVGVHTISTRAAKQIYILNLIVYTVNATNFFGFGVDAGDAQIGRVDNGNSQPINFSTPIRFFGTSQSTLYVRISQLNLLAGAVYCDVATVE